MLFYYIERLARKHMLPYLQRGGYHAVWNYYRGLPFLGQPEGHQ